MQSARLSYSLRKHLGNGADMTDGKTHVNLIEVLSHAAFLGLFDAWQLDRLAHGLEVPDHYGTVWYIERNVEWR